MTTVKLWSRGRTGEVKEVAAVGLMPTCDVCKAKGCRPAKGGVYNAHTAYGWANVCFGHLRDYATVGMPVEKRVRS